MPEKLRFQISMDGARSLGGSGGGVKRKPLRVDGGRDAVIPIDGGLLRSAF